MSKKRVVVGLSGGVDSSVSALLLKQQGYDVQGLFMKNWQEDEADCPATMDLNDARCVCAEINIPLHTVNFSQEYWDRVFQHFLDEYAAGRTPNPDIMCNKEIKFKAFLEYAVNKLGADYIATGHYVRSEHKAGQVYLLKGLDPQKDQSYFLYALSQQQLQNVIFPVGELEKPAVREIAEQNHLITAKKKDSTGICFIGERRFKDFLAQYLPAKPGVIKTIDGEAIAQHDGLMYYTIGQRQGLGIGGLSDASEEPWYVVDKEMQENILLVAQGHDHPRLFAEQLLCNQINWIAGTAPSLPLQCKAKIRYRQTEQSCCVTQYDNEQLIVKFDQAQRAITTGQSIVFYDGEYCLGGGIITATKE